ncbi:MULTISPECIES: RecT family recombinase [Yersinia]|uniref:RecT family n=1 Tax=Yersinia frederiksenii TaxID=29484 RepID=A0AAI8ZND3_YERFR|nr:MULTISPECIES: RecT family recombinase [Yersinia]MDN0126889.1 RecT family recombinase [Yersinia massiliensis]CFQ87761.1 RecT family [Yersinia frederiksenii]
MSDLTVMNQQHPSTMSASSAIFNVQALAQLTAFANLMADSTITVPAHFVGKPADCMAVVMQAMQWGGMNPYAVAQKTYLVNGVLGYEAQLVNAVITSSTAIRGRFHYEYGGDWSKCTKSKDSTVKKPAKGGGTYDKIERVRDWSDDDEQGLFIRVGAIISGEDEITWGEPVYFSSVVTRNSPLWVSNPKQQIAYLAVKYWARLYCPEVILGVYTPDEVEQRTERDVTPPAQRASISQMSGNQANVVAEQPASNEGEKQEAPIIDASNSASDEANFNYETLAAEFRESIDKLQTLDSAKNLRVEIEDIKQQLGNALYTELKGKAVKKYHQIDARNYIEAAINSLDLGSASRVADFAKVEQDLKARKSKLGDELFDGYTLTLDDLRVEFS